MRLLKAEFLTRRDPEFQLIESMLWRVSYQFLPAHLKRLESSARYFDFAFDADAIGTALLANEKRLIAGRSYKVRVLLERSRRGAFENARCGK